MGRASKWIRKFFLGGKKEPKPGLRSTTQNLRSGNGREVADASRDTRRWSFGKNSNAGLPCSPAENLCSYSQSELIGEAGKHKKQAMAVAAAAVAADAAMAAAHAAALALRWAGTGRLSEQAAAIKIQTLFRGYLARKALRALKSLIKLQALVRGFLVRKQADATLSCMQSLVRVQARARAKRITNSERLRSLQLQCLQDTDCQRRRSFSFRQPEPEDTVKVVQMEMESLKMTPNHNTKKNVRNGEATGGLYVPSAPSFSEELKVLSPMTVNGDLVFGRHSPFEDYRHHNINDISNKAWSLQNSPRIWHSRKEEVPSYMANTLSSQAKARSQSAPKQRPSQRKKMPSQAKEEQNSGSLGSFNFNVHSRIHGATMSFRDIGGKRLQSVL